MVIEVQELLQLCDHILPEEHQHWVSPTYICRIVQGEPVIREPQMRRAALGNGRRTRAPLSSVTRQDFVACEKLTDIPAPNGANTEDFVKTVTVVCRKQISPRQLAFGQRLADDRRKLSGSPAIHYFQTVLVISWISLNHVAYVHHWDPYPFILLNLAFHSICVCGSIIMMSQNRRAERDRENAIEDFTNLQAKEN